MRYTSPGKLHRSLTADQIRLGHWFQAMIASGRGPRKMSEVCHALIDAGMSNPSYETLLKAGRVEVLLPAKYAGPLACVFGLTADERRAFAEAVVLAHAAPLAADLYRAAFGIAADGPIPNLAGGVAA